MGSCTGKNLDCAIDCTCSIVIIGLSFWNKNWLVWLTNDLATLAFCLGINSRNHSRSDTVRMHLRMVYGRSIKIIDNQVMTDQICTVYRM